MKTIAFFLMGFKGYFVLESFISEFGSKHIEKVITARDINIQNDYYQDIIDICENNNIKHFDRTTRFDIESEYAFAISWRWLINDTKTKLIVLHDSLLPKYRGFAPLVTALINGDKEIGVTALFANEEFDRGKIISQYSLKIEYPIKINDAINSISVCYKNLVNSISNKILNSFDLESVIQDEEGATYSLWLDEEDYHIDWSKNSEYIKRFIDCVGYPYNGAKSFLENEVVRITNAEVVPDVKIEIRKPGKVLFMKQGKPIVVCGQGLLQINEIRDSDCKNIINLKKFRIRFK